MDILSSSSSYPTSPSASVRWLIVSIPHSSPFQVDARGTAAASLLVLLFLLTLARWHWAGQHGLCSGCPAMRRVHVLSRGQSGTKQSDGVQSGCTPWMAALFSGPPLILVGRQLRPLSSSARAMRDVPFILQLGSSPCIGLERCHSLEAGPSGGLSPTSSSSSSLASPCLLHFYHSSPSSPSTLRRRGPWARPSVQLCAVPWMASAIFSPVWGSSSSKWHLPLSARRALSSALRARPPIWVASAALRLLASLLSEAAPTARSPAQW